MSGAQRPDVYFTQGYGEAECTGTATSWLSIDRHDGRFQLPLILRPVADGLWDAASPYGYSGAYAHPDLPAAAVEDAWASAQEELRQRGVVSVFLRHSPLVPQAPLPSPNVTVVRNHPTVAIDVGQLEAAWTGLEGRCRTAVRKARKSGVTVNIEPASAPDLAAGSDFRTLYEATMQRRAAAGFYFFSDDYYDRLRNALGDDLLLARGLDAEGAVVTAALFMRHGKFLHYHLSGSGPDAGRLGANNLLLWSAAEHAAALGVDTVHLGGGTGPQDPLYRFKASFGSRRLTYGATGLVTDPAAYDRLSEDQRDGATTGFFPAYRGSRRG